MHSYYRMGSLMVSRSPDVFLTVRIEVNNAGKLIVEVRGRYQIAHFAPFPFDVFKLFRLLRNCCFVMGVVPAGTVFRYAA